MIKSRLFWPALLLLLLLSGCSVESDDLLSLPRLPEQYVLVQDQIDLLLSDGVTLAAPVYGAERSPIQMVDLGGDGTSTAIPAANTSSPAASRARATRSTPYSTPKWG